MFYGVSQGDLPLIIVPLLELDLLVLERLYSFWSWWPISQRAMLADLIVLHPPVLHQHLRLQQRREDFPIQQFVP